MRILSIPAILALLAALSIAQTVDFSPVNLDATQPVPGRTFSATVSYPADPGAVYALGFDFFRTPAPIKLAGMGELGLAMSPAFMLMKTAVLNNQGKDSWSLVLPNDPNLIGFRFYLQAFVATSNSTAGAYLSNLYIGDFTTAGTHTLVQNRAMIPRALHSATLLKAGHVLIVGGGNGTLTSPVGTTVTEIYYPWTKKFDYTRTPQGGITRLNVIRTLHTATLLDDGRVLIAGGVDSSGNVLGSAELFDPATGRFSYVGNMVRARATHTATKLPDGRVLIAGGTVSNFVYPGLFGGATNTTEIFNPATNTFTAGPSMSVNRMLFAAVPLQYGGKDYVLMMSGIKGLYFFVFPDYSNKAEVYDVAANAFSGSIGGRTISNMRTSRAAFGAALEANGRVLVVGGAAGTVPAAIKNAEEFNPATATFSSVSSMALERVLPSVTGLSNGKVLVQGGILGSLTAPSATATSYLYSGGSFSTTAALKSTRGSHVAILLPSGAVLVLGGADTNASALDTAEFYTP